MKPFYFKGSLPASKSILNRLLILQSFEHKLKILGDSDCDDVQEMRHVLSELGSGHRHPIDCGAAGTTFRFFALRASRVPGEHHLTGSPRLMARPQEELISILRQLGVNAQFEGQVLVIHSRGWDKPKTPLKIDRSKSSQFASAVLLNSWGLNFDLEIEMTGEQVSEGYFEITEELITRVGMRLERNGNRIKIPAKNEIVPQQIRAEMDLSSAFAVAALAAVGGEATLENFPFDSTQPDVIFPEILKAMGVLVQKNGDSLRIARTGTLLPVSWNLKDAPDLFPVLSVLCAFADGTSKLLGAPQLVYKESSRIQTTARLIKLFGRSCELKSDGIIIQGKRPADVLHIAPYEFDPDQDHRLAMAAGVAKMAGVPVTVLHPLAVNKSFPGFWDLLEPGRSSKFTLVIGHRGTGKSHFLSRVREYYRQNERPVQTYDLDTEIGKAFAKPLTQIFNENGEAKFREIEVLTLERLAKALKHETDDVYVVAGAGFTGEPPEGWEVLWLRRPSDANGRIFFDRPRLNEELSAFDEYQTRYLEREPRYKAMATKTLTIAEGFDFPNPHEESLLFGEVREATGSITLLPEHFKSQDREQLYALKQMGFAYYELRDDLLNELQCEAARSVLPSEKILFSLRDPKRKDATIALKRGTYASILDWPNEFGELPLNFKPDFVSFHKRDDDLTKIFEAAEAFEKKGIAIKIAVPIENFDELKAGHQWWQESPEKRVFLPSSKNGRWSWYRLWQKPNLKLNFVREGEGSGPDQPYLFDWIRYWPGSHFAAVLGDPVAHSRTPAIHREFFASRSAPVFAIQVHESEWESASRFLPELGLRWAAVTAPLKEKAYASSGDRTALADDVRAVNTLLWNGKNWIGTNTDIGGMEVAIQSLHEAMPDFDRRNIAIWGGGGTLNALQNLLPQATPFSARTLVRRDGKDDPNWRPDIVIWSVGRSRWQEGKLQFPSETWQPKLVWDLNYTENSPGREYAQQTGARYISGLEMFEAQAELQREFWKENERDDG